MQARQPAVERCEDPARFPDTISRGARGGPERRTQIVELASGDEEHNASWANSRPRYDVSFGIRRADELGAAACQRGAPDQAGPLQAQTGSAPAAATG